MTIINEPPLQILKVGGSIITNKKSETPKVNDENIKRVASEIADGYDKGEMSLIIIHGAGSYGHPIVKRTEIDKCIETHEQKIAFAETQRLQNELDIYVTKYLIDANLPAIPCQASSHAIMNSGRLEKMDTEAIKGFLEIGLIPVLYGVPAYDKVQKCSILSGDQIAPYLAKELDAKKIIHATNVDGIYTADPNIYSNAEQIPEINSDNIKEVKNYLTGSNDVDVTGGMYRKVTEILNCGVESQIISALIPGNITRALKGEKVGTIIKCK